MYYFYINKESFTNKDKETNNYTINLFNQYKNYNCNKAILYNNKKMVAESVNDKCIWNPISGKYNLEVISQNKEDFDNKIKKIDNNVYTIGDNYYIKCINHSLFKTSKNKDFRDYEYTIHHNFIKKKDFISINKYNKSVLEVNYKNSIKDKHNKKYKLYGDKYDIKFLNKVDPLFAFNIFYLIKEIHRNKYIANFDKK